MLRPKYDAAAKSKSHSLAAKLRDGERGADSLAVDFLPAVALYTVIESKLAIEVRPPGPIPLQTGQPELQAGNSIAATAYSHSLVKTNKVAQEA
jgi:hypothetical protein